MIAFFFVCWGCIIGGGIYELSCSFGYLNKGCVCFLDVISYMGKGCDIACFQYKGIIN